MPASIAFFTDGTKPTESAGASTIRSAFWVMKFSTALICVSMSVSEFMPTMVRSKVLSSFCHFSVPSPITLKNSFANDFITRPTCGRSPAAAGAAVGSAAGAWTGAGAGIHAPSTMANTSNRTAKRVIAFMAVSPPLD